ncbi:hypothetical protein GCM10007972_22520 [Iodidimonas muriae]|uniref:Lipoprotein n=1 Tax=Iodidimonas muriae TaxID=261467 RepID=A0ABQ2LF91_9PROT|nr:hypothetical protein [Iodidimonas muriae]GER07735.1 hypothetical protein JCM17843_20450 [Kordiimonadales bacterium JCM 17843]GGO14914.1 hypothetical protein GCM10007972_22520 [Iodidimonas muriae]
MKQIMKLAAISALMALAACGEGNSNQDRYIAACVAGGYSKANCTCASDTLHAELDEDSFSELVKFHESIVKEKDEAARSVMAMGAFGNPKLLDALEKTEKIASKCMQAARSKE